MKRYLGMKNAILMAAMVSSFVFIACGANGTTESTEKTDSTSEGLHEVGCITATPDVTESGVRAYNNSNVGSSYGSTSCPQQFVLRMSDVPAPIGGGSIVASIQPSSTVSQDLCPDTEASLDVFGWDAPTQHWTHIFTKDGYGAWENAYTPPPGQLGGIPAGCNYGQYGEFGLGTVIPSNYDDIIIVGAMLQHPANKSTAYDEPIAMGVNFESPDID